MNDNCPIPPSKSHRRPWWRRWLRRGPSTAERLAQAERHARHAEEMFGHLAETLRETQRETRRILLFQAETIEKLQAELHALRSKFP